MDLHAITFDIEGHVATITLDRPASLNSFNDETNLFPSPLSGLECYVENASLGRRLHVGSGY